MSFLMIGETNFSRQYSHNVSKYANRSFYGIKISSSLCGWIKFDVPFFVFRRANNYDEKIESHDRSIANEISLSSYFSFITFLLYFSLIYSRIPIKFE